MATGDELRKSLTGDAAVYHAGVTGALIGGQAAQVLGSWACEKKAPTRPSAQRSAVASADAADLTALAGTALVLGNSAHVACYVDSTVGGATTSVFLVLLSEADTILGVTEIQPFVASATHRLASGGNYVAPRYVFDAAGAAKVKAAVSYISGGAADITLKAL